MSTIDAPDSTIQRLEQALQTVAPVEKPALLNALALAYLTTDKSHALFLAETAVQLAGQHSDEPQEAEGLYIAAQCFSALEQHLEAREKAHRAVALFSRLGNTAREAEALYFEALSWHRLSSYPESIAIFLQCAETAHRAGNISREARALQTTGSAYLFLGKHEEALYYGNRSKELFEQQGDKTGVARASLNIGNIYYTLSQYDTALEHLLESYHYFASVDDKLGLSQATNNIGNIYSDLGDYARAIEYTSFGLQLHRETRNTIGEANALTGLGILYLHMQQYDEALQYHTQSLSLFRHVGFRLGEANAISNIGNVYLWKQQYEAALEYYQQSLPLQEQIGNKTGEFDVVYNIGLVYGYLERSDIALEYYHTALSIAIAQQDKRREAWVLLGLGRLLLYEPPNVPTDKTAREYVLASLSLAESIQSKNIVCEAHQVLADLYAQQNDYKQSLFHYREFHQLQQQVFSEDANRRLHKLVVQHRIEKTEKERELFRVKSEQLEQEMEFKLKELASLALHLVEKNEFLDSIRPMLHDIARLTDGEPLSLTQKVLQRIEGNIHSGHDWAVFNEQIQTLSNDFIERLTRRYPVLTPTEVKVCSLLKIRLSTKDIANLMHITTRAVEKHRYQIRKKLNLPSDTNLSTFFAAM
jgi:tetratricopeptide (TPR) repeat protein/DNA-binding CsgD family transcriptional regulator